MSHGLNGQYEAPEYPDDREDAELHDWQKAHICTKSLAAVDYSGRYSRILSCCPECFDKLYSTEDDVRLLHMHKMAA